MNTNLTLFYFTSSYQSTIYGSDRIPSLVTHTPSQLPSITILPSHNGFSCPYLTIPILSLAILINHPLLAPIPIHLPYIQRDQESTHAIIRRDRRRDFHNLFFGKLCFQHLKNVVGYADVFCHGVDVLEHGEVLLIEGALGVGADVEGDRADGVEVGKGHGGGGEEEGRVLGEFVPGGVS